MLNKYTSGVHADGGIKIGIRDRPGQLAVVSRWPVETLVHPRMKLLTGLITLPWGGFEF